MSRNIKKTFRLLNLYPPYLGAGIRVTDYNEDVTRITVTMRQRWYNRNIFGTHFGGSLYSMCDPFFVFILMQNLGKEYIIWDKTATIRFRKPGRGKVTAVFQIAPAKIEGIRAEMQTKEKATFWFNAEVTNEAGEVVAEVEKEIYVRRKY